MRALLLVLGSLATASGNFAFPDFTSLDGLSVQGVANRTQSRLRLTPAVPNLVASVWHDVKQSVVGGFRTDFSMRVVPDEGQETPGPCKWVDHLPKSCARRGGDGLAFVIQNFDAKALGMGGGGLGYAGIPNAVAIELDTWYDAELRDPYENHVAVFTRGTSALRSEHGSHLGVGLDIPDLADGERHDVRIEYEPVFTPEAAAHHSFQAGPHLIDLVYPPAAGYQHGLGVLKVWVDDTAGPSLTVPMNFGAFLDLESGTAWVGFTSATGASFQNHEILSWVFYERQSEQLAVSAALSGTRTHEQRATIDLETRWRDETFARVMEKGEL